MDDIEKQIEGDLEENEEKEMKPNLNYSRNDNKKKIFLFIILGILALCITAVIVYLILNKDEEVTEKEEQEPVVVEKEEDISNKGYVSCDDNTSLLNVRNSTTGDIIDGLSCYEEITIEEELDKTDNCDKWYKISYNKNDSSYTGYVCATYIKKEVVKSSTKDKIKNLIDKVNEYYETIQIKPYCGTTSDIKTIKITTDGGDFDSQYAKSEFKTLDELKESLTTFMDASLISSELSLSDYNNPKMYDNYYEIDGDLYCRNYTSKGYSSRYTGNYNIEVTEEIIDKAVIKIAYEYITEETLKNSDAKCTSDKVENCTNSQLEYKINSIEITKKDDNYIVTKFEFHK